MASFGKKLSRGLRKVEKGARKTGRAVGKQVRRSADDVRDEYRRVTSRLAKVTIQVSVQMKNPPLGALLLISCRGAGAWYEGAPKIANERTVSRAFKVFVNTGPHVVEATLSVPPNKPSTRPVVLAHRVKLVSVGTKDHSVRLSF